MKEEQFKQNVENFIETLAKTKIDCFFNPWAEDGKQEGAALERCKNLQKFLLERQNPKFILIGEAPSYGARFTGIPMTSEKILTEYLEGYYLTSKNDTPIEENTAKTVWEVIKNDDKKFVMWNAFAFNKNIEGEYVEPKIEDITNDYNKKLFKMFLELYPNGNIITVGRSAQIAISYVISDYVRHPSHGGTNIFLEEMKVLINKYSN